jgi:hypothetical protein
MKNKPKTYPQPEQYDPPVAHLLTVGDPREHQGWPDYPASFDITLEHVTELIRMVQDERLNWADSDSDEVWAPLHAWRTLAQLRAETAVDAIIDTFYTIDDWDQDWQQNEYPAVMAMIGPPAISALKTYLADERNGMWSRITAAEALGKIGQQYPESRDECVAILSDQLSQHQRQDPTQNAFLISSLVDLKAIEAVGPMKLAFNAGDVDLSVLGDWEEVQIDLGLLKKRLTPPPEYGWIPDEYIPMAKMVRSGTLGKQLAKTSDEPDPWKNVGRNDPCPCGSGKKYKNCHGFPGRKDR